MTYFEQHIGNHWTPCTAPRAPTIKNGRERGCEGATGHRTRGIKEILPVHEGLTLSELQAAYGVKP